MIAKLLTSGILAVGLVGCATAPVQTAPTKFEKVYDVAGLNQAKIYDGARQWFAVAFRSANAVVQYEDKSVGTIIGKGSMAYPCSGAMDCMAFQKSRVEFTTRIDTKDGKIRVAYEDLHHKEDPSYSAISGVRSAGFDNQVREGSKVAQNVVFKLDQLSSEMVSKIQAQEKVNSNW